MKYKFLSIIILYTFIPHLISAQNTIQILEKDSHQSIYPATVCFEGLTTGTKSYQITDANGKVNNSVNEKSLIAISFVGYKTILDTIMPNESKTYFMNQDVFDLDQVVVTGTRTAKRLADVPVQTIVIGKNEISKAGSCSTLEALQDFIPGIVSTPNGMGNNLKIRGLNSRYILFLVDGERLISEGANGNINFDQVDVNDIERIEVVNEAASALYGSNAVGGVFNIITQKPTHSFEGGANISYQDYNTQKYQVTVGSKLKKLSTRVNLFRNSSDGYDKNDQYTARYTDYGSELKLGYRLTDRIDVNLNGRFFQHETFNPDNSMNVTHDMDRKFTFGANTNIRSKDNRNNLKVSVNVDKFYSYDVLEKQKNELEENWDASYTSTRITDTYSPNKKWEFIGGAEYNHEQLSTKTSTILGSDPTTKKINDVNVFGQAQYSVLKGLDAILGTRYTYNDQFNSAFTPKLSLMYKVKEFIFRGSLGTAFRAPDSRELYYQFNHQGAFMIYGNPDLKAEKGIYSSLSAEYTKGNLNASVSVYHNKIDNKITSEYTVSQTEGELSSYHYKNVSSATLKGIDFNVSYLFLNQFILKASYSYCDAQDDSTGLQLNSNVKNSATLSLTWNGKVARSPFSLQLSGRMNSPMLYQSASTDENGNNVTEKEESKSYSIWKAVLIKPFRIKQHSVDITLKCNNIFNFKEESFVDPGRQYFIGLRYKFK